MARRSTAEIATGAAVLLVALGFLGYAVAHTGRGGGSGYAINAAFDHIDGLTIGSDVRLAGVKIGSVTSEKIDTKTYLADVSMQVEDDIKLPKDSSAVITSDSLLGGKYMALSPGASEEMLASGGTITITQGSVSLEQLLGKFIFSMTNAKPAGGASSPSGGGADTGADAGQKPAASGPLPPLQ